MAKGARVPLLAAVAAICAGNAAAEGLLAPSQDAVHDPPPSSASPSSATALPAPGSPMAVVRPFYERFGLELEPAARDAFVDPARSVLDAADELKASGQGECLDPNMALDNAAPDKAQVAATLRMAETQKGDEARVVVAFAGDGVPHRLEWKLHRVGGAWKISDLLSVTGEWALSQYQCK